MQYNWKPYAIGGATRPDSFSSMTQPMQQGLWQMLQAADSELGSGLQVYSGYRSPELQAQLWQNALKKYGSAEKARKWVAPPGRSRHNTGQAADLKWNGTRIDKLPESHPARQWLTQNVARFGLAQPMSWEPWQVEVAGARGTAPQGTSGQAMSYGNAVKNPQNPIPNNVFSGAAMSYGNQQEPTGLLEALAAAVEGGDLTAPQQPAPQPVQMAPAPVAPIEVQRRGVNPAYNALFASLMR